MKKFRTMLAFAVAAALVLAMSITAFAAGTGSITITPPSGTSSGANNEYKIYKVFDATVDPKDSTKVSYKLVSGKTTAPAGFTVDAAGNVTYSGTGTDGQLTEADIAAIAAYVTDNDYVSSATSTGTATATASGLAYGYYYITTSTGTTVTIDSNNDNPTVNDKNTVPSVDKTATDASSLDADGKKALAQVGTSVEYKAEITVGKGAKNYVFHDVMGEGLQYNNDAKVNGTAAAQSDLVKDATPVGDDTITIAFKDGLKEGTEITITYSATITSDALQVEPAKNTAKVSYGDATSSNYTPDTEVEVYNAKFTVFKVDGDKKALAGAGFVIQRNDKKYYKNENNVVTWVDAEADATELVTEVEGEEAKVAFTGLANGTYTLIEKTVPDGYNKADNETFTVEANDYTAKNLDQVATVSNMPGTELPSTGGIGTTIFYILGSILVIGAGVLLVTKRRMDA